MPTQTPEKVAEGRSPATDAKQDLMDGLNEDLAAEYQAIIHYLVGAQLMSGHGRPELKQFFESEIQDELGHAQFLAHKIVALGGTPTVKPRPVELGKDNREQLEIALESEKDTIERYRRRIQQADAVGDAGLRVRLEDILADETEHKEELELVLRKF